MSSLWLGPTSFIRVVGRSRSPVTRGAPAKEENLHEHPTQFAFSNPGAGELRNYLRLPHLCKRRPSSRSDCSISNWVRKLRFVQARQCTLVVGANTSLPQQSGFCRLLVMLPLRKRL